MVLKSWHYINQLSINLRADLNLSTLKILKKKKNSYNNQSNNNFE